MHTGTRKCERPSVPCRPRICCRSCYAYGNGTDGLRGCRDAWIDRQTESEREREASMPFILSRSRGGGWHGWGGESGKRNGRRGKHELRADTSKGMDDENPKTLRPTKGFFMANKICCHVVCSFQSLGLLILRAVQRSAGGSSFSTKDLQQNGILKSNKMKCWI